MGNAKRKCSDCEHYIERTAYNGYCDEWDCIVELVDSCLDDTENSNEGESK